MYICRVKLHLSTPIILVISNQTLQISISHVTAPLCNYPLNCVGRDFSCSLSRLHLRWRWSPPTTRRWPVTGTSRHTRSSRSSTSWSWPPAAPLSCRTNLSPPARSSFKDQRFLSLSSWPPPQCRSVFNCSIAWYVNLSLLFFLGGGAWTEKQTQIWITVFFSRFLFIFKLVVAITICTTKVVFWQLCPPLHNMKGRTQFSVFFFSVT